jgi:hypothetical protein
MVLTINHWGFHCIFSGANSKKPKKLIFFFDLLWLGFFFFYEAAFFCRFFFVNHKFYILQEIERLELLCKQLYESQDTAQRSEAEKALFLFQDDPDALAKCQLLLDRGNSSYSQLLAATTLTKLISRNVQGGLNLQQRVDIRNYILNYLATRPNLQNYVIQALVALLAKLTKYGWFDLFEDKHIFRNIVSDVKEFLQVSYFVV